MNRDELAALLAALLARRAITSSEAQHVLDLFDAGDLAPDDLPTAQPKEDHADWLTLFAMLLLLLGGKATAQLATNRRWQGAQLLRGLYDQQVMVLGQQVSTGAIAVVDWQAGMQSALSLHTRQMAIAGVGTLPDVALRDTVEASLAEQWPYLERFGLEILTRQAAGRPLSAASIVARSRQYGGVSYDAYWRGEEEAQTGGQDGYVVYYESMDDPLVCGPCLDAQRNGPYLPGTDYPRPGGVCVARGFCRCVLRIAYEPDTFAQLSGRQRAA